MRATARDDGARSRPGGGIYDNRSTHDRDLLDNDHLAETHFDAPIEAREILAEAACRWRVC